MAQSDTSVSVLHGAHRRLAFDSSAWVLIGLVAATLVLHLGIATVTPYGLHRDELLYLAQGRHLDWGFLEVPPFIAFLARTLQETIGESVFAVRLLPAIAGAALMLLTGLMTRRLEDDPFAVLLAGTAVLIGPVYLRTHTLFQPVPLDQLWWTLAAFFVLRRITLDDRRQWLFVGIACGLGLITKYSILVFGAALFGGLLLTSLRRDLATPWPWLAALIAFAAAIPNLVWQAAHDWPLLSHVQALSETQLVHISRVDFLVEQILMLHPITFPVWGAGLYALFQRWEGRYRVLGWTFVVCLVLLLLLRGKPYYLAPAYPMLFAAGSAALSALIQRQSGLRTGIMVLLLASGIALGPMGVPVLPPPAMARYLDVVGLEGAVHSETGQPMRIPQDYADMLGWREQATAVADVYHSLPPADREDAVIITDNYGEAGAIDRYDAAHALPAAVSTSGSYYLWGPGSKPGRVALTVGIPRETVERAFQHCTDAGTIRHTWAREREVPLFICRSPHRTLQDIWPTLNPW